MRLGFFSDAHGNIRSTIQCIKMMRELEIDDIYFLGDAIGYMPSGVEVLELLFQENIPCIMGNHEAMAIGLLPLAEDRDRVYKIKPLLANLPARLMTEIKNTWPITRVLSLHGKKVLLVHGRPSDPLEGYLYQGVQPLPEEVEGFDVIVVGHTHRPFVKHFGGTILINGGSCGLPRDIGNAPSFAVYDVDNSKAEIHRFEMDINGLMGIWPSGSVHESVISCLHREG